MAKKNSASLGLMAFVDKNPKSPKLKHTSRKKPVSAKEVPAYDAMKPMPSPRKMTTVTAKGKKK